MSALLVSLVLGLAWAADPAPTMLIELLRDEDVVAAVRVPISGGTVATDVAGLGLLSVRCPAPITAGDGIVVYRDVAIELIEPGDRMAVTTALSASFASGGQRKAIGICARGSFTVTFPK